MIPSIVCVQFLLIGVDLGVAVDDNISGGLFSENLRIDIRNMFHQYNGSLTGLSQVWPLVFVKVAVEIG